jgi:hypothetical protein
VAIIDDDQLSNEQRKQAMGEDPSYEYLFEKVYPSTRIGRIEVVCVDTIEVCETASEAYPQQPMSDVYDLSKTYAPTPISAPQPSKRGLTMAIKSNLLADVAAIPQLAVEFSLNDDWSITGNYHHAWWSIRDRYYYTYGGGLELRYWLDLKGKRERLEGHHFGVYCQLATFDFETNTLGYLARKPFVGVGISYGYSIPLYKRLMLDLSIGLGYVVGKYEEYKEIDSHYVWQNTKRLQWFGPTKAEASLVWVFGNRTKQSRRSAR